MIRDTLNQNAIPGVGEANTLNVLSSLIAEFSSSLDLDQTMQHVVVVSKSMMNAEGMALFLLEKGDTELVCRVCCNPTDITGIRFSAEKGIVGRSIREGTVQLIADASADPDFFGGVDKVAGTYTQSILSAPLMLGGKKFGALEAMNKLGEGNRFDEKDRDFLATLAYAASLAIHNAHLARQLLDEERTRQELSLAREIQEAVLPNSQENGKEIAGYNIPARSVSGDFYDYLEVSPGRFCFCLGDVSGKGVTASLLVARVSGLFRYLAKRTTSPAELLQAMNNELLETTTRGMFVTMVAGYYDRQKKSLELANAGHQPPLQMQDSDITAHKIASPPLAILAGVTFESYRLNLENSALYIFTDGLTECWTGHQTPLEEEGVRTLIRKHASAPLPGRLKSMVDDAIRWKIENGGFLHDDITLLVIDGAHQ